jgi:hypothetical protein
MSSIIRELCEHRTLTPATVLSNAQVASQLAYLYIKKRAFSEVNKNKNIKKKIGKKFS